MSMACHPLAQVTTCKDGINIHHSTKYKVTDASSQHYGKDQISLREHQRTIEENKQGGPTL